MSFSGHHVVITGGAGGLGTAVVRRFIQGGAHVHVPCIAEVPDGLDREGVTATPNVNLTDEGQAVAFFASVPSLWASVHLAGTFAMNPVTETSAGMMRKLFEINVMTCFLSCREAVKRMRSSGDAGGRIVNVAARPVLVPTGGMTAYVASKSSVAGITLGLAEELAGEGIFVNAIAPSIIDTPANRAAMPDADHATWPKPDELAAAIVHLASPDNTSVRGAIVPVYGRA